MDRTVYARFSQPYPVPYPGTGVQALGRTARP